MKKINILILSFLIVIFLTLLITENIKSEKEMKEVVASAAIFNAQMKEKEEEKARIEQEINDNIPGIVVWGDSHTTGAGGNGISYPKVLQNLIKRYIEFNIPVVNMGVGGEDTYTILGRANSIPFVVSEFTIPEDKSKVKINIYSSNGNSVAPLRQGEVGMNPVVIEDIEGTITLEQDLINSGEYSYHFNRLENGQTVQIKEGTEIQTASMKKYNNYIPIVFIGEYGKYEDGLDLVNQINTLLEMDKWNDRFLVIGLTTGDQQSRAELENAMQSAFGDRYLNLRQYIVKYGLTQAGLEPTVADINAIKVGAVPPSLLYDTVHFNELGYRVIGNVVYEKLIKLGYFANVLELVEELKALE